MEKGFDKLAKIEISVVSNVFPSVGVIEDK